MLQNRTTTFSSAALRISFCFLFMGVAVRGFGSEPGNWPAEIRTLVNTGKLDLALEKAEAWIGNYPDDLDARAWHARILSWQGRRGEAEVEYRAVLERNPLAPDVLIELSRLLNLLEKHEQALELLDRAASRNSERADYRLERARTLRMLGRQAEARTIYRAMLRDDVASAEASAALAESRAEDRHEFRLGGSADLLSYAQDGSSFTAALDNRWNARWRTSTALTRYSRFGISQTGGEASVTYLLSASDAITLGGGSAGNRGIAPRAQMQVGYDHGVRLSSNGFWRGLELTYDQRWFWYPGVKTMNVAPGVIVYLPRNCSLLVRSNMGRIDSGDAREWHPSVQARLTVPVHGRYTAHVLFANGAENFGTVDQILFRASKVAGGGWNIRLASGQEFRVAVQYQRIAGGRSQMGFGGFYVIRF